MRHQATDCWRVCVGQRSVTAIHTDCSFEQQMIGEQFLEFDRDDTLVAAAGGDSHEVLAGTGVAAAPRAAQPGAGQQRRMTEGEMAKLAAAEAEATKRAKKAAKKVGGKAGLS